MGRKEDLENEAKAQHEADVTRDSLMVEAAVAAALNNATGDVGISAATAGRTVAASLKALADFWTADAARVAELPRKGAKGRATAMLSGAELLDEVAGSLALGYQPQAADRAPGGRLDVTHEPNPHRHAATIENGRFVQGVLIQSAPEVADHTTSDDVAAYLSGVTNELKPGPVTPEVARAIRETTEPTGLSIHRRLDPTALLDEVKVEQMTADPFSDPTTSAPPNPDGRPSLTFSDLTEPGPYVKPEHRSHSQLTGWNDCNLSHNLRKHYGYAQMPAWAMIGGTAFHAAVETIEREMLNPPVARYNSIAERWKHAFGTAVADQVKLTPTITPDRWRAAAGGAEGWSWWQTNGEDMLERYVKWRTANADLKLFVGSKLDPKTNGYTTFPVIELELTMAIPDMPIPWLGRLDRAWSSAGADGQPIVIVEDVKTGKSKPTDTLQLAEQAWAISMNFGISPERILARWYDARRGETTELVKICERHPFEEITYLFSSMDAMERSAAQMGLYPARTTGFPTSPCVSCSVRYACPVGGRS